MKKLQRRFFILLLLSWAGSFYHRYCFHSIQIDDAQQTLLQHQPQQPHEKEEQVVQNKTIRQPAYYRPPQNADDNQSQRSGGNEQMMISPSSTTTLTYADLIQRSMGLPAYTMRQAIDAANTFTAQYAIVVYDPEKDNFKGYYSQNHQWVSSVAHKKLSNTITTLTWLLRKLFPERFTPNSPEKLMI